MFRLSQANDILPNPRDMWVKNMLADLQTPLKIFCKGMAYN
jgi:hypothetical protein